MNELQLGDLRAEARVTPLDRRIAEMRSILAAMKQATAAESLTVLRERFPDVPLQDRMRALSGRPS